MPTIRLSPAAAVVPTAVGLCVRSDLGTFQIGGADAAAFVEQVAPLCDGTRDRAALVAALGGYSAHSVNALLDTFAARGLLEDAPDGAFLARAAQRGQEAFFRSWPEAPAGALRAARGGARARRRRRALVHGGGRRARRGRRGHRAACGDAEAALTATSPAPWNLLLGARAPEDAGATARLSRLAHRAGLASLWAHVDAAHAFLGPLVTPGQTACLACASVPALSPQPAATPPPLDPRHAVAARLLGHHAALVALQVLSGYTLPALGGRLLVQDLATLATSRHTLVRLPWCPVCGG